MNFPLGLNPDLLHRYRQPPNHNLKRDEEKKIQGREKGTKGLMETKREEPKTRVACSVSKRREAKEAEGAARGRGVVPRGAGGGTTPTAKRWFPNMPRRWERWNVRGPQQRKEEKMSSEHWICSAGQNQ